MKKNWRKPIGIFLKWLGLYNMIAAQKRALHYRSYTRWVRTCESKNGPKVSESVLFSIVVPTHKYTAHYLEPLIDSVIAQDYPKWELILVNACSSEADANAVNRAAQRDPRIKEVRLKENLHISGNTNAGIGAAIGDYISFLDHDDLLASFALSEMAAVLAKSDDVDVFYSDEDKVADDGTGRTYAFFKPDFDPELILTSNYICHFLTARSTLVKEVGGLRPDFDGAQDYDLILRLLDHNPIIHHIPRMSYHWRMAESSTAVGFSDKSYASEAGRKALEESVARQEIKAEVIPIEGQQTAYRLKYEIPPDLRIALVAPDLKTPLRAGVTLISQVEATKSADQYDVIAYLKAGITPLRADWLDELAGRAFQPDVGVVSAAVVNHRGVSPQGYVQTKIGLKLLEGNVLYPEFSYMGASSWPRTFSVVPDGCYALKGSLVGRGDRSFVELCVHLSQKGLRNVFWSYSVVKNQSAEFPPGLDLLPGAEPVIRDPYFNANLTINNHQAVPELS